MVTSLWPRLYLCVFVYCSRVGQTLHRKYLQYTNSSWPTLYLCVFVYCSRVGQTLHRKYMQYTNSLRDSTPIWLDGVQCTGSEDSLTECRHRDWGDSDCDHMDDVSIACYDNTTFTHDCECSLPPSVCTLWSTTVFPACMLDRAATCIQEVLTDVNVCHDRTCNKLLLNIL